MWNDVKLINAVANTLYMLVLLAVLATGVYWLVQRPTFSLDEIEVDAVQGDLKHVSVSTLKPVLQGRLKGNFFTVDLDDVRQQFEAVPWVRKASVRRAWPNRLVVRLEEHQVLGVWNDVRLMNSYGESFTANIGEVDEGSHFPSFSGPEGSEQIVFKRYRELNDWLKPLNSSIANINLSHRYAWRVKLENDLVLELGRDPEHSGAKSVGIDNRQIAQRVARFVNSYSVAEQGLGKVITHVDLRYPNGYAVQTKALATSVSSISPIEPSLP